jgi:hypothetical protein
VCSSFAEAMNGRFKLKKSNSIVGDNMKTKHHKKIVCPAIAMLLVFSVMLAGMPVTTAGSADLPAALPTNLAKTASLNLGLGGAAAVGTGWYWTLIIYVPLNNLLDKLSAFDISLEGDHGSIDPTIINKIVSDISVVRIEGNEIVYPTESELAAVHTTLDALTFDGADYEIESVANIDIAELTLSVDAVDDPIVLSLPPELWLAGLVVDYTYWPDLDVMVFTWAASIETIPGGPLMGAGVGAGDGGASGGKGVGSGQFLHALPHVGTMNMGFDYYYDADEQLIVVTHVSFSYTGILQTATFIFIEGYGESNVATGAIANLETDKIADTAAFSTTQ